MPTEETKESLEEPHEVTNNVLATVPHDERDEDASDAQAQVIASLRSQVTDLFSQVTQLNSKLVASYDRVSGLEDQLHDSSASMRNASITISSLELERSHHLAALNTGLLVEKAHVTAELNRLMERATEEAAQRGQAESARHDIEKDLDDLSATLFDQANTMVAEARLDQARSERKVREAEEALKSAEEAVKVMQAQMQALEADKERSEREAQQARISMGKGKWIEREDHSVSDVPRIRFMTTHAPYAEFVAFVAYLRTLRSSQSVLPAISSISNQPFLSRLLTEDSEPTLRLDLAPSLNWLSRRSVLSAIYTGMLIIEPVSFSYLLQEIHSSSQSAAAVSCALCGTPIVRFSPATALEKPPSHPLAALARSHNANGHSWFKYPLALSSAQSRDSSVSRPPTGYEHPEQVYIFRLSAATASQPPPVLAPTHAPALSTSAAATSVLSRPPIHPTTSSRVLPAQPQNSLYPLCTSNYCLLRLRSTCSLWAFVRAGILERVWEEHVAQPPKSSPVDKPLTNGNGPGMPRRPSPPVGVTHLPSGNTSPSATEKPPVPPRRRRLWEMASVLGEKAVGWGKEGGENAKEKVKGGDGGKQLPTPPPAPDSQTEAPQSQGPPPVPKRNGSQDHTGSDTGAEMTQNGTADLTDPSTVTDGGGPEPDKNGSVDAYSTPVDEIASVPPSPTHDTSTQLNVKAEPVDPAVSHHPPSSEAPAPPQTPTLPVPRVTSPIPRPRSRVISPASPPSRVGSPRPHPPGSPIALSRSRAGSPAPVIARTASPATPSRTGSPAPHGAPPLPRRAAARRAVPVPPTASAVSEPSKDKVASLPVPESQTGEQEDFSKSDDGPKETNVTDPDITTEVASKPANSDEVASVSPAATLDDTPPEKIAERTTATLSTAETPAPVDSQANVPERTSTDSVEKSFDTASTKRSSSTDDTGFASDATWEERTWKEVARLKEEMFWARIGGVRST